MATTAVSAAIVSNWLCVGWVGDSRCYLYSDEQLEQITRDHTATTHPADRGAVVPAAGKDSSSSHILTQCLGRGETPVPETRICRIHAEDIVLLCTDGLTDVVTDEEIAEEIRTCRMGVHSFEALPRRLVNRAIDSGTQDNVTALCYEHAPPRRLDPTAVSATLTRAYPEHLVQVLRQTDLEVTHA